MQTILATAFSGVGAGIFEVAADAGIKATVLLAVAICGTLLLRNFSAVIRHRVWTAAFTSEAKSITGAERAGTDRGKSRLPLGLRGKRALLTISSGLVLLLAVVQPVARTLGTDEPRIDSSALPTADPEAADQADSVDSNEEDTLDEPKVEPIRIAGRVLDAGGQPAAHATVDIRGVVLMQREIKVTSDSQGAFAASVRVNREALPNTRVRAASADGSQLGYYRFSWDGETTVSDSIEIKLESTKVARVSVVDAAGRPIQDAHVAIQLGYPHTVSDATTDESGISILRMPQSEHIEAVFAWKDHAGLDYRLYSLSREQRADVSAKAPEFPTDGEETLKLEGSSPLTVSVVDDRQQPLGDVRLYPWLLKKDTEPDSLNLSYFVDAISQRSDAAGRTTFNWIPVWHKSLIQVWPTAEAFVHKRGVYDAQVGSGLLEMQLDRLVPIRGRVVDGAGNPVAGITVTARGAGYTHDDGTGSTSTDGQGQYELVLPPDQIYLVVVKDPKWASAPQTGFAVFKNQPVTDKDFTLRPATRVYGTLIDETSQEPIAKERVIVYQYGQDLHSMEGVELPNPENSRRWVQPMQFFEATTDEQGRFEFALGDGSFDIRPPQQEKADKFIIAGEAELELQVTTKVQKPLEFVGSVVGKDGKTPLEGARVTGVPRSFRGREWQATTGADGTFRVKRYQEPTFVHAVSDDKLLAAIDEIEPSQQNIVLQLQPVAAATGRLFTADSNEPFGGQKIDYGVRVPDENNQTWSYRFGGRLVTEADGTFHLDGLVAGWEYTLNLESGTDGSIPTLTKITLSPRESVDLGDLRVPLPSKPYVSPTLEDRIRSAFDVEGTPVQRRDRALELIKLVNQHLLIVFGVPDDPRIHRLMEIRYNDDDFRTVSDEFRFLSIPTDEARREAAQPLADSLDESLADGRGAFLLVVLDREGKKVATADSTLLCIGDELSKDKLLELLRTHLTEPLNARALLDEALQRAAAEDKCVIVQETATWCGPCHLLSRFLDSHRVWEKDYIWVKMDHRWTGARELMAELREGAEGGIPWFAILDASGQLLVTSNDPKTKQNIGYPSEESGQIHFQHMLNSTRQRLTEEDVKQLIGELARTVTGN
ncbi:MAG: carboxypeptidase regulatory-like domain-containing protein [Pirellulaceae bacterium]